MQAERVVLKTDAQGNLIGLPKLPPNTQLEAIFLLPDTKVTAPERRTPPAGLRGTVTEGGGTFEPLVSDEDRETSLERTARQIAGEPEAFE